MGNKFLTGLRTRLKCICTVLKGRDSEEKDPKNIRRPAPEGPEIEGGGVRSFSNREGDLQLGGPR